MQSACRQPAFSMPSACHQPAVSLHEHLREEHERVSLVRVLSGFRQGEHLREEHERVPPLDLDDDHQVLGEDESCERDAHLPYEGGAPC